MRNFNLLRFTYSGFFFCFGNLSLTIGADDEWKEWNKLGDPVLHIDLRGELSRFVAATSIVTLGMENNNILSRSILRIVQCPSLRLGRYSFGGSFIRPYSRQNSKWVL